MTKKLMTIRMKMEIKYRIIENRNSGNFERYMNTNNLISLAREFELITEEEKKEYKENLEKEYNYIKELEKKYKKGEK